MSSSSVQRELLNRRVEQAGSDPSFSQRSGRPWQRRPSVCSRKLNHRPSFVEMVQSSADKLDKLDKHSELCIPGQRQRPCLPSTLSLRPQLSPSRRASIMRLARRSEKAVSPSATAQSDTTAAGPLDTLLRSRSSRRRWSLRSLRRRYAMNATIF